MIEIYKEYAELSDTISTLEKCKEQLKSTILSSMKTDKEQFDFGKFTKATRKSYTYSDRVKEMEENVAIQKIKEVEKGIAELKETTYLVFKK